MAAYHEVLAPWSVTARHPGERISRTTRWLAAPCAAIHLQAAGLWPIRRLGALVVVAAAITTAVFLLSDTGGSASAQDNPGAAVPAIESNRLSSSLDATAQSSFSDNKITQDEYVVP
jgi:hypothetical protein